MRSIGTGRFGTTARLASALAMAATLALGSGALDEVTGNNNMKLLPVTVK